jgi:hypothetical protein
MPCEIQCALSALSALKIAKTCSSPEFLSGLATSMPLFIAAHLLTRELTVAANKTPSDCVVFHII